MAQYFAKMAYLPEGWADNVVISVDDRGWITSVTPNQAPGASIALEGALIPGMPNLHSHAFQRAMAGLAERVVGAHDSFWSWREAMYKFSRILTPEDQGAIAAQLYVEMLKGGYTAVGEFHYLHHQPNGTSYPDIAAASRQIIAAAQRSGIGLTHLPVLYAYGGFGAQHPGEEQKRFINRPERLLRMIESLIRDCRNDDQISVGLALHSLRAVSPDLIREAISGLQDMAPRSPIHIHAAEQIREVQECVAWCGQRPIEWLVSHAKVDARWCIVHATHMTEDETRGLAATGAVAGLCPTTEANLGDGFFNLKAYLGLGGTIGIGSDSNISVSVTEELRLLEYGQRLLHRERAVTRINGQPSIGTALYTLALRGGAQALGRQMSAIAPGKRADLIAIDTDFPHIAGKPNDLIFDSMIFAGNLNPIRHVIAGGKHLVRNFRHIAEEEIFREFHKTLEKLEIT